MTEESRKSNAAEKKPESTEDLGKIQKERLALLAEQQEIFNDYVTFSEIRKDIYTKRHFLMKLTGYNTYTKTFPPSFERRPFRTHMLQQLNLRLEAALT